MESDIEKQAEAYPGLVVRGQKVPYVLFARKAKVSSKDGKESEVVDLWPLNLKGHSDPYIIYQYANKGMSVLKFWLPNQETQATNPKWEYREAYEALMGITGRALDIRKELEKERTHTAALEARVKEYERKESERVRSK